MHPVETVARRAVEAAGDVMRTAWANSKHVEFKGPVDIVTATDREVEALVVSHIQAAFPDHTIVAEEASASSGARQPADGAAAWYLDPLDGTVNFAHSVPHFCISLAFGHGTAMEFAIVHDPLRGETFHASRGNGAFLNGKPIAVSDLAVLDHALIGTGLPYDRRERTDYYLAFSADLIRHCQDLRRFGSAALDLCYVACGRFDAFWEWGLKPWDTAAGSLIVREAGGLVTDFRGGTFELFGNQTLASNARVHSALSDLLSRRIDV